MFRWFFVTILSLLPLTTLAFGEFLDIELVSFKDVGEKEQIITFYAKDTVYNGKKVPLKKRKYIVHITFEPEKSPDIGISSQNHNEALSILRAKIKKEKFLKIVRAGGGYNPIKNKNGEFRSCGLGVLEYEGEKYPVFIKSSLWYFEPY